MFCSFEFVRDILIALMMMSLEECLVENVQIVMYKSNSLWLRNLWGDFGIKYGDMQRSDE